MVAEPIVKEIDDNIKDLLSLKDGLSKEDSTVLFVSPTVYIHNWKHDEYRYDAYVGEANDVLSRTQQHFQSDEGWHKEFKKCHEGKKLFIIGHPHFNKSMTLDVENRLMQYMSCMKSINHLCNGRGNPQRKYYPCEEFEEIFSLIWGKLHEANDKLFAAEQVIRDSALFKCSPLHHLSEEQLDAKQKILEIINKASKRKKKGNLVFVEGEAGTGKSVLMSSLFYDLVAPIGDDPEKKQLSKEGLEQKLYKCRFIINHNEQLANFNSIFRRLGLSDKDDIVTRASAFIHKKEQVDVAFVDEAHLLCTQGNQGYSGEDQLEDIMQLAKTTVIIFDENQILTREQYVENATLIKRRNKAIKNGLYYQLKTQFRIQASEDTKKWIDEFTKGKELLPIPRDTTYDLKIFEDVGDLYKAIKAKADSEEGRLSRVLASYDWAYNNTANRQKQDYEVQIGAWHLPWNYEISRKFTKDEKKKLRDLAWAEQPHTIGEVGSTFTIQGFDLTYAGVILGPSISWDKVNKKIVIKGYESKNGKVTSRRTLKNGNSVDVSNYLVQHELRVLMTRGVKGMYIYAVDESLRKELLRMQRQKDGELLQKDQFDNSLMYVDFLPFYTIAAACGKFGAEQRVEEPIGWVRISGRLAKNENLFVVRATGHSMEPKIKDGEYCVFEYRQGAEPDNNDIVLAEHSDEIDDETRGAYSIKKYVSEGGKGILRPINPDYKDIVLDPTRGYRIVGVLRENYRVIDGN